MCSHVNLHEFAQIDRRSQSGSWRNKCNKIIGAREKESFVVSIHSIGNKIELNLKTLKSTNCLPKEIYVDSQVQ